MLNIVTSTISEIYTRGNLYFNISSLSHDWRFCQIDYTTINLTSWEKLSTFPLQTLEPVWIRPDENQIFFDHSILQVEYIP